MAIIIENRELFEEVFLATQQELAQILIRIAENKNIEYIYEKDKYLLFKGTKPLTMVAHLDTKLKHTPNITEAIDDNGNEYLHGGGKNLGADDRAGVWACIKSLDYNYNFLFTFHEELGKLGALNFVRSQDFIKNNDNTNIYIQFDRANEKEFATYGFFNERVDKIMEDNGFNKVRGSYTDIATLMENNSPYGINVSCGYYFPHKPWDRLYYNQLMDNVKIINDIASMLMAEKRIATKLHGK